MTFISSQWSHTLFRVISNDFRGLCAVARFEKKLLEFLLKRQFSIENTKKGLRLIVNPRTASLIQLSDIRLSKWG